MSFQDISCYGLPSDSPWNKFEMRRMLTQLMTPRMVRIDPDFKLKKSRGFPCFPGEKNHYKPIIFVLLWESTRYLSKITGFELNQILNMQKSAFQFKAKAHDISKGNNHIEWQRFPEHDTSEGVPCQSNESMCIWDCLELHITPRKSATKQFQHQAPVFKEWMPLSSE